MIDSHSSMHPADMMHNCAACLHWSWQLMHDKSCWYANHTCSIVPVEACTDATGWFITAAAAACAAALAALAAAAAALDSP